MVVELLIQIQSLQTIQLLLTPPKIVYITMKEQIAVNQAKNQFHDYVSNDVIAFFSSQEWSALYYHRQQDLHPDEISTPHGFTVWQSVSVWPATLMTRVILN